MILNFLFQDEELCLIEENAKNKSLTVHYSNPTPDLALPSPPHNDDTEIVASNEPLPSPPYVCHFLIVTMNVYIALILFTAFKIKLNVCLSLLGLFLQFRKLSMRILK